MKRVIFWGWSEPDLIEVVKSFISRIGVELVDWIGDTSEATKSYVEFLYNPPDLGKFQGVKSIQDLTSDEKIKFLDMFSREKRARGLDYHEQMNLAKSYFRYFVWHLSCQRVTHVYFSIVPIIGIDYLCYLAAKRLGINVTMCYQSIFPNRFFYCDSIEDFGLFTSASPIELNDKPIIDWGYKKDLFYMKGTVRMNRQINPIWRFFRESLRYGIRKSSKPMLFSGVIQNFVQAKEFNSTYPIHAKSTEELNKNANYVYFPLHLQPELTTTGLGGSYSDQIDAIERLAEMIPDGWLIYAKENPKQGHEQRGVEFFRRLATIGNVVYIDKHVDTYWLMENSQFVATITGTAGWEAITGGKACLVFGLAWYRSLPGAVGYSKDIRISDILEIRLDRAEQVFAFDDLIARTRAGVVDKVYVDIYKDYESSSNVKAILDFLDETVTQKLD